MCGCAGSTPPQQQVVHGPDGSRVQGAPIVAGPGMPGYTWNGPMIPAETAEPAGRGK